MRKATGTGEKVKAGLAKKGPSKSIKPDKASTPKCLGCTVSGANAAPLKLTRQNYSCACVFCHMACNRNFYLWTVTIMPLKTLIHHSARYKCLAQHCGSKKHTMLPKNNKEQDDQSMDNKIGK